MNKRINRKAHRYSLQEAMKDCESIVERRCWLFRLTPWKVVAFAEWLLGVTLLAIFFYALFF